MKITTQIHIDVPKEKVWKIVTDIDNAVERITAITEIEVLENPENKFSIGYKWKETRIMFGKEATEIMWVTDLVENDHYKTRAESHGAIYVSTISVEDENGGTKLSMGFDGQAQTFGAKIMSAIFGTLFKGATKKAIHKDLEDIKKLAESK